MSYQLNKGEYLTHPLWPLSVSYTPLVSTTTVNLVHSHAMNHETIIADLEEAAIKAEAEYGTDCYLAELLRYAASRIRTLEDDRRTLSDMHDRR